jgi:hypothetical protein
MNKRIYSTALDLWTGKMIWILVIITVSRYIISVTGRAKTHNEDGSCIVCYRPIVTSDRGQ